MTYLNTPHRHPDTVKAVSASLATGPNAGNTPEKDLPEKRVRVLFVLTKLNKNGAVLSVLSTMRHLEKAHFEPVLFLAEHPKESQYWQPLLEGVQVVYGLAPHRTWPHRSPLWLRQLFSAARRADILVGAQEASSTYFALLAAKLTGKPVLGLVQNSLPDHLEQMPNVHRILVKRLYPLLTGAVAVSEGVRASVERLVPALERRVTTAYNLIEVEAIRAAAARRAELPPQPYIVAVGRLSFQKGFDLLIRAYAALRQKGCEHTLVILGDGKQKAELERLAARLGVAEHVMMPGFVDNPYPWVKGAAVFVSSSRYEGFCRVIAEALAVGTPVVATDCPSGPAEVLEDGRYGVLVESESSDALVGGIHALLCDPARLQALSEAGPARAAAFAVGASPHAFEEALLEALSSS